MAVYVDDARNPFGRMQMCHMVADSTEELLAMAALIGVDFEWLQAQGTAGEHFDVCRSKRALAVRHGALETTTRTIVDIIRRKRGAR